MNDFVREPGITRGGAAGEMSTSDYRIREVEARLDRRLSSIEAGRGRSGAAKGLTALTLVIALAALGIVVWAVAPRDGARTMESLSTREVVLRDGEGVERGRLGTDSNGQAQLSLSDREGRERLRLTVLADGSPGVTISDPDGRPRAVLGYLSDGTTNLVFADEAGTSRAVLGLEPDGSTQALFADQDGAIRTLVGVGSDGEPSVSTFDATSDQPSQSP